MAGEFDLVVPDLDGTRQAGERATLAAEEPPAGRIRLVSDRGEQVTALDPGEDGDRSGGVGGWNSSDRPFRFAANWWGSIPGDTMSLPLLFSITGQSNTPTIETRLATLYRMGRPVEGAQEPPGIKLLGAVPARDKKITWKLDDISLGARMFNSSNELQRLRVTLSLSRLVRADEVERVSVRATRNEEGQRRHRTIRTRKGDTLRSIAVRYLGSAGGWKDIRKWNPKLKKVDPDAPLRAELKVVLK